MTRGNLATSAIKTTQAIVLTISPADAPMFIRLERDEMGIAGNDYHVADQEDVETFYDGCRVLAVVDSTGEVEHQ